MIYVQQQRMPAAEPKATHSWAYYPLMALVMLYSLVSVFFLPIDIAAIKMSLDPGFTIFFVLVLIVFGVKMLSLLDFYILLFVPSPDSPVNVTPWKTISWFIIVPGTLCIGASLAIIVVEIYLLTQSIMAVLIHPFVMNFGLFMLCNILAYAENTSRGDSVSESYEYMPITQEMYPQFVPAPAEMQELPMIKPREAPKQPEATQKQEEKKPETPIQKPQEPPKQPEPPKYPELPIQVAPKMPFQFVQVPASYPEMPFQVMQAPMQYVQVPQMQVERPRREARTFMPYFIPQN